MKLRLVENHELQDAMSIINGAKEDLKKQGINQWQEGYPDIECIQGDIQYGKGYFVVDEQNILGYLCIDYDGEPAYKHLNGQWHTDENYVVVHRMAFRESAKGKGISTIVFQLVEEMSKLRGVCAFRVDTDKDNLKMQHILTKNGFTYRGTIWFDYSEKIAFDKIIF
ncbi:GNAT family N-acetyltransferase [Anaerorhabdus furcosa]|uniref:Acetyltransferase (GNAT) domain-containing protein n=1 Tax=Anaerorhabdus furcosa TaxID=118967 RepID=A0A1T4NKA1_9FIRM|nr:GNAT family N-acetyltransferase [Anaerorhabdus furcosa]SJZ79545.1 Acetyltransferase (GNAT) domain-containing protein [Anaerorhabdus furcosa]